MIGEATKLEESLHYKSNRSLPFATFVMKLQHMFNLYRNYDTALSIDAKLRLIFRKINSPSLINCLVSLGSRADLASLTFDKTICHITTVISRQTSNNTFVSNINVSSAGCSYSGRDRERERGCRRSHGLQGRGRGRGRGNPKSFLEENTK